MIKFLMRIIKAVGVLLGLVVLYVICGLMLPLIPVQAEETNEPAVIELYILTNGVHTDLVMPVKNDIMDWSAEVSFDHTLSKRTDFNYLAIGWGDKGFYLETPTWAELQPGTALRAAFWMSESALHCTFYEKMTVGDDCRKIMLTETQYRNLVAFIKDKFDRDAAGKPVFIETEAVYGRNDVFYDAKGSYSFLYTCNTWTNDGLKVAGQKAALWTPTDFGIFRHYR
ncbi:TIGR02117 family protein [Chryseobacterium sp. MFBS3-17]|uniref:TIGR02117 family protein n=1 Tax=Chryseobacterium sp. MFBS3-17 TaxID=2886689 RepID=UPI001D0E417E|nr:TIGR02117 family protein [Chryseobacterium sp. MFBS3-17]MCC2591406.1 TIGR02117 family protein [Chryseobacterium sp. MFBS3-17]